MDKVEILNKTHDGLDVFTHYFGDLSGKLFCNTYRNDTNPSCKLYRRNGKIVMVDYGSPEWSGDCFTLVSNIYGLSLKTQFAEVIKKIKEDLSQSDNDSNNTGEKGLAEPYDIQQQGDSLRFMASIYSNPYYLSYWKQYHIYADVLSKYNVYALKKCRIIKTSGSNYNVYYSNNNPLFGYFLNNNKGIKLYQPYSHKYRFLYAGELIKPYVFGMEQLPDNGDHLFLTGGEKDVLSLASHGYNAISFNSETAIIPFEIMKGLCKRFKKIHILYDVDRTGLESSEKSLIKLRDQGFMQVDRIVLPITGSKKDKDISDFFKNGHTANEFKLLIM